GELPAGRRAVRRRPRHRPRGGRVRRLRLARARGHGGRRARAAPVSAADPGACPAAAAVRPSPRGSRPRRAPGRLPAAALCAAVWIAVMLGGACAHAPAVPEPRTGPRLFVLGRAQDGGLPHVGCDAPCCAEARRTGRRETPACLGVHDPGSGALLLIEATPAVEEQLALLHRLAGSPARGRAPIDAVL